MRINGLTAAEELFCLEVSKPGVSQADAYFKAFPGSNLSRDKSNLPNVRTRASELSNKPKIKARILEIRQQAITNPGIMELEECLLTLSHIARADIRKTFGDKFTAKSPKELDDMTAIAVSGLETMVTKDGSVKNRWSMLSRSEAVDKLLKYHLAVRQAVPEQQAAMSSAIDEPNNRYEWARRIAYVLSTATPRQITTIESTG
jgi:hypothetical protein